MSKFEKKFGKYAIKNISLMLIMCYAVGYLMNAISPQFLYYLTLDPYKILFRGQIWRLITWVIVPPSNFSFFTLIMLFFYYSIGNTLERTWGTYRYNVYLFSGMFFTILGSFLAMGTCYILNPVLLNNPTLAETVIFSGSSFFSTYYINMSIFLAFAATFPDAQVLLMFVIPVKMKWMGIVYAIMLGFDFITATGNSVYNIFFRFALVASLFNFVVFWLTSKNRMHLSPKQMKRRQEFKHEVKKNSKITKHKCAICGQTEDDDPTLEFRFCSKCDGNYEYCQHHLFTHEHVKKH